MITVSCYSCGADDAVPYATENGCALVKCVRCGLLYVNPRPSDEEIEEGIKIGAHSGDRVLESTGRYMPSKEEIYRKVLHDIYGVELQRHTRKWLDVGCGHGELLLVLKEVSNGNVLAKGLEPNRNKIVAASQKGLDVDFFDLTSHAGKYDCISLLNVYSHLTDPPRFLTLISKLLAGGGELLIQTGDTANLEVKLHPRPFLLPDHLSFASEEILSEMLRKIGFELVTVTKYPTLKLAWVRERFVREAVKMALGRKSQIPLMYQMYRIRRYKTDMWIRARLRESNI